MEKNEILGLLADLESVIKLAILWLNMKHKAKETGNISRILLPHLKEAGFYVSRLIEIEKKAEGSMAKIEEKPEREIATFPRGGMRTRGHVKPPVGVMPQWLHRELRMKDLLGAMLRKVTESYHDPSMEDWIEEAIEHLEWRIEWSRKK